MGQDVSRETVEKLQVYEELARKWTSKVNLVSKQDHAYIWQRHILDSVQVARLDDRIDVPWLDIGSGGGFPGLVVAIFRDADPSSEKVTLVESDTRKCAFLRTASGELGLNVEVINRRIELIGDVTYSRMSARALTSLRDLLDYASKFLTEDGFAIFPKGIRADEEIQSALVDWEFKCEQFPSILDPQASILKISSIQKATNA